MRRIILAVCLTLVLSQHTLAADRPRLAILTDIGGDPDDQQSMIRLMAYSNEFDIEALIASASGTPGELKNAMTRPDLILQIIDAYGAVLPNLKKRASGWPEPTQLRASQVGESAPRSRKRWGRPRHGGFARISKARRRGNFHATLELGDLGRSNGLGSGPLPR